MKTLFASKSLAEWREILARQEGQWDVVQHAGEMQHDCQVLANRYMQPVAHPDGRTLNMVSVPIQFDGEPLATARAPDVGEHSEAILADLGLDEQAVLDLKIAGVVF